MKRCKDAAKYQPIYPPKCGCDACVKVWQDEQRARIARANSKPKGKKK